MRIKWLAVYAVSFFALGVALYLVSFNAGR